MCVRKTHIPTCVYNYITYIQTYIHTDRQTDRQTHTHTHTHTHYRSSHLERVLLGDDDGKTLVNHHFRGVTCASDRAPAGKTRPKEYISYRSEQRGEKCAACWHKKERTRARRFRVQVSGLVCEGGGGRDRARERWREEKEGGREGETRRERRREKGR